MNRKKGITMVGIFVLLISIFWILQSSVMSGRIILEDIGIGIVLAIEGIIILFLSEEGDS